MLKCRILSLVLVLPLTACGSWGEGVFGSSTTAPPSGQQTAAPTSSGPPSLIGIMLGQTPQPQQAQQIASTNPQYASLRCPPVEIRSGTETLRTFEVGSAGSAADLKWQATIFNTARECNVLGAEVGFKVGVAGRVLLGPKGAPGTYTVPVRIALVRSGTDVLWSRINPVTVNVLPGEGSGQFTHVVEDILIPREMNDSFSNVQIFVGFDPNIPQEKGRRRG